MALTSAIRVPLLLPFLASFEGGTLPALKVDDGLLLKWRASEAGFQGGANALRYHQGRVLGARLASIPYGMRSDFKDEWGDLLNLSRRSIELRVQIATELDVLLEKPGKNVQALRRSVLDRPWREVLAAVRLELYGPPARKKKEKAGPLTEVPSRASVWQSRIIELEDESFDSLDDLKQWVSVLQDAMQRAEVRREELLDEMTEVPVKREAPVIRVATMRGADL